MAIIHDATINGIQYPEAYSRILLVRCEVYGAFPLVLTYADEAARQRGDDALWVQEHPCDLAVVNHDVFPSAYSYLKSLPEFAGAVDHLGLDGRHIN